MNSHIDKINTLLNSLDEETKTALESISVTRSFEKGTFLLRQDETCRKSYVIISGIARKFFNSDKKEITTEFYFAEDLAVSFSSYVLQEPSTEKIECMTDVTATVTDYFAFQKAREKYPKLLEFDLLLTELYTIWLEERLFDFHALNATQRYEKLILKSPELIKHIKLTHIASYLGVSLETLSRIRSRI